MNEMKELMKESSKDARKQGSSVASKQVSEERSFPKLPDSFADIS